jgi:hypothetical protein
MFRLDDWETLEANDHLDKDTLAVAKELAFEMCAEIFERLGLSATPDSVCLRVAGRGTTVLFPLRGSNVPLKDPARENRLPSENKRSGLRGRPPKVDQT